MADAGPHVDDPFSVLGHARNPCQQAGKLRALA
jgi:hypothetical protein